MTNLFLLIVHLLRLQFHEEPFSSTTTCFGKALLKVHGYTNYASCLSSQLWYNLWMLFLKACWESYCAVQMAVQYITSAQSQPLQ